MATIRSTWTRSLDAVAATADAITGSVEAAGNIVSAWTLSAEAYRLTTEERIKAEAVTARETVQKNAAADYAEWFEDHDKRVAKLEEKTQAEYVRVLALIQNPKE